MRGEIYLVPFPEHGGPTISGPHPALIVSSDRLNPSSGTVVVCPMTSRIRHDPQAYLPPYLVPASARATGLQRDGYVKVDQVHTLAQSILGARMGRANPDVMDGVDRALGVVLGLAGS